MKKSYYIIQSNDGCLGASGTIKKLKERFTNKKDATAAYNKLRKGNVNNHIIYWINFEWIDKDDTM